MHRKDEFTMKKLLALFIIGGLLSTITGCPPGTTTAAKKGEMPKGMEKKRPMTPPAPEKDKDKGKTPSAPEKDKDKDKTPPSSDKDKDKTPPSSDKDKDKAKK
jgi:hypothetical protein